MALLLVFSSDAKCSLAQVGHDSVATARLLHTRKMNAGLRAATRFRTLL
jgi:hypothetical protein